MSAPVLTVQLSEEQLSDLAERIAAHLQDPEPERWLNTREAAAYLGVHLDTLRRLAAERRIPSVQEGPRCRLHFKRSELDAYRQGATAPSRAGTTSTATALPRRGHERGHGPRLGRRQGHGAA
jgi:excisionase family DNA binding protein